MERLALGVCAAVMLSVSSAVCVRVVRAACVTSECMRCHCCVCHRISMCTTSGRCTDAPGPPAMFRHTVMILSLRVAPAKKPSLFSVRKASRASSPGDGTLDAALHDSRPRCTMHVKVVRASASPSGSRPLCRASGMVLALPTARTLSRQVQHSALMLGVLSQLHCPRAGRLQVCSWDHGLDILA